ncbi:ABC transporter substrate-binding protein [Vallitalea maricola]|uniref:Sugar ABC transporter substrate-binding protein n=1 Tax=Vallitalea maricola TaxID=3074433 RepID=A0ACB5UGS2_9FIRM|nr:sugar ABC transporter substrate-binding protein [Vallitalea sp. AN17-2]
MSKKILSIIVLLTLVVSLLVGCKSETKTKNVSSNDDEKTTESNSNKEKKPVTIKVATWTDTVNAFTEIIKEFEKENPLIKVDLIEFPSQEHQDKLVVQLAGGADIDVMAMKNTADYSDIAVKNQLLQLDDLVKKYGLEVASFGPLYNGLKIDNKLYSLPFTKSSWVLYYNKDLFDKAGVDYPSDDMTWAEFRELAKKMTRGEGNEKIWGAYLHTWPQSWYGPGLQTGATIVDEDLTPFKDALQLRMDLEKDGSIMSYIEQKATNAHYKTEFAKGTLAMNIIGEWHIDQLRTLEKEGTVTFDWDIAPMPHPEGVSPNTTWGMASPIGINAKSKKVDASWEFIKFATGLEGAKIFAEYGRLPAYNSDEIKKIYVGDGNSKPNNIGILVEQKVYFENPTVPGAKIVKDEIFGKEAELTFAGERSVEDTMKVILERTKSELNK